MPTLRDDHVVRGYVVAVQENAFDTWSTLTAQQRGEAVVQAGIDALKACGVPAPARDVRALAPNCLGAFDFGPWALQISNTVFEGAPDVDVAETVYHESRHCEQWYHMARFHALGKGRTVQGIAQSIHDGLGINNMAVCNQAAIRPMKQGDPMDKDARVWYESVYGRSSRDIVLTALGLKRTGMTFLSLDDFHHKVHTQYSGGLPEEADAWGIQVLVRTKFATLYPPPPPLPITAAKWKTLTARDWHTRSGDLKALDAAMAAYENARSRVAFVNLRSAFNRWHDNNHKEAAYRNVENCVYNLRMFLNPA